MNDGDNIPAISVVIPALNAESTIARQLQAVLDQECHRNFEVIIADNGSSDSTVDIIERFAKCDRRVRLVDASRAALGGAAAKNWGAREAQSNLLAFCDADDLVAPGWLQGMYDGLTEAQVICARQEFWQLNPSMPKDRHQQFSGESSFLGIPTICGGAFAIHRDLYFLLGGFDETFQGAVDTEFGLRLYAFTGKRPNFTTEAVVHCRVPTGSIERFRRYSRLGRSIPFLKRSYDTQIDLDSSLRQEIWRWLWLVRHASDLLSSSRMIWFQVLGVALGVIQGRLSLWRTTLAQVGMRITRR